MRPLLTWIVPALASFAAWWIFLGTDENDTYSVPQVAGLVLVLIAIAVVCGGFARRTDLLPLIVSAVMGVAVACWSSWSDDDTGLFVVGWMMVVVGTALVGSAIMVLTWRLRESARERNDAPRSTP